MKKSISLSVILVILSINIYSQNWKANLPDKNKTELTFYDYQNAFNEYWEPYNVDNGKYIDKTGVEQKAYGWKQFKRWEYFWESRINIKTGKFPKEKMHNEYKKYLSHLNKNKSKSTWTSIGPNSSTGGYAGIGRVATVAFHPTDDNTFWIGAPAGGLWVTTSGGNDWTALTENNEVLGVSAIVIPSDYETSQTIYIGTGDRDAFDNNSIGVLKSNDAGATWQPTGLTFLPKEGDVVNNMLIHPTNNDMIFAATTNGMYISSDAGINWNKTSSIGFIDIEFKPGNPNVIYASTRGGRIYKSDDTGNSWTEKFYTGASNRAEIAVSYNVPERLYVLGANSGQGLHGIWTSNDSGETFNLTYNSGSLLNWSTTGTGDNSGQAWYDLAFDSDPTDADILFLGGVNTWMSDDGGNSWSLANHWYGGGGAQAVHADKHYFKYRPGTSTMFECNDGGVYKTNDGNSWIHLSNGLVISQMYGLSTAQTENNTTISGLQDNGTKAMLSGTWYDVMGGDGMKSLIDFTDAQTQYGSSQYGNIERTTNGWNSSTTITPPESGNGPWVTQYVLDPNNNNILYVGRNSLWKSENKGNTYENLGNFGTITSIAIAPSNSNTIYISSSTLLRKSINGGQSWESASGGLPTGTNVIKDIAVKHDDANTLWVALGEYTSDGVYESTDGGNSWTNISSGLPEIPVNAIIQNKFEVAETQLYAGTDFGVYIKNGTNDWELYGTGIPKAVITEMDIYYDNSTPENSILRASTYGRGLWEVSLELSGNFVPNVSTEDASNIYENGATVGGEIVDNYGFNILESGIIISSEPNPIYGGENVTNYQTDPTVIDGTFTFNISNLESGTNYYYKAYAQSENGIGYGNEITFSTNCTYINTIPYYQDFENYGLIPNCWSEIVNSGDNINWIFGDLPIYHPYQGEYCAYIKDSDEEDDISKLILPAFNFSAYDYLHLSFWHIQVPTFSFQDELKILYKSNLADDWTVLKHYTNEVNEWTEKHVNLPNLSDTYYLAFEGNAKFGKGIGIDDVSISEGVRISKISEQKDIKIYPNPSKGIFNVYINNSKLLKTYKTNNITDITGKQIKNINKDKDNNQIELDLSQLPKGIYFINLVFKDKTISKKLFLE